MLVLVSTANTSSELQDLHPAQQKRYEKINGYRKKKKSGNERNEIDVKLQKQNNEKAFSSIIIARPSSPFLFHMHGMIKTDLSCYSSNPKAVPCQYSAPRRVRPLDVGYATLSGGFRRRNIDAFRIVSPQHSSQPHNKTPPNREEHPPVLEIRR